MSLFRNLGLKALSVAIAVLLWLTLSGEQIVERGIRVPLEVQNLPGDLLLVEDPPEFVEVRVRGASGALGRMGPGDLAAVIDVSSVKPGRRLFHLTTEQIRVPVGVEVTHASPPTIPLAFERAGSRELPVLPSVEGEPAPGYVVGRASSDPPTVMVVGPESRLAGLTAAITEPVVVDGASSNREETVTVGVLDTSVRLETPQSVRVVVEIMPAPIEQTTEGVPVRLRGASASVTARVRPQVVAVRVRGSREALSRLPVETVVAFVDLSGLGPGRYSLPVQVEPSRTFGVAGVEPALVQVDVR
jgi:YbbR domain-containing protein